MKVIWYKMEPCILTFDIGTSSCKAVLFNERMEKLAEGRGSYPIHTLDGGRVEQIPEEILKGFWKSLEKLKKDASLEGVQAVSFSSQMSAQCLVGQDDKPLTNILSWMDKRAVKEVEAFGRSFSRQEVIDLTGMDMVVTPAYGIAKLRWLKSNAPELVVRAKFFVQIKEIIIHALTGEWVSDATSLKGIVSQKSGRPIPEIMDFIGVSEEIIPAVKEPYDVAGRLRVDVAQLYGLPPGIPVVVGWNDMNAAFLGMAGVPEQSLGLDMTGTSEHFGVISVGKAEPDRYEGLNKVPFLNQRIVYYGVTSSGGQVAEWFSREILQYSSASECFAQLNPYEQFPLQEVKNLIFIPYIEGERNPWNDTRIRGAWIGLERMHKQKHMAWGVLEGVCFALKAMYDRFPVMPEKFIISGGASNSDVWTQMKADVLGSPFECPEQREAGCIGAAVLAMRALHPTWSWEKLNRFLPQKKAVFLPNPELHHYYEEKYNRFLELYHALKEYF